MLRPSISRKMAEYKTTPSASNSADILSERQKRNDSSENTLELPTSSPEYPPSQRHTGTGMVLKLQFSPPNINLVPSPLVTVIFYFELS